MPIAQAVVLQLATGLVLANLPFTRPFGRARPAWTDAVLWLAAYGLWMGLAAALAADRPSPAAGWEIIAISGALFAVLAFPGIVWRYMAGRTGGI